MLIQIISFTGFQGSTSIESNTLTQENLNEVMKSLEINPGDNSVISYSYKTEAGRQTGDFTANTTLNTNQVVLTVQMRETKAASYTEEEVAEIIAEAKEALKDQDYKSLRTSCRDLAQVSSEIKEVIGNYTHYSVSSLISAIERALNVLAPETEVSEEQLTEVWNKINFLSAKVEKIANETSNGTALIEAVEVIGKVREDLAFVANHLGLVLPNHPELYKA